MADGLKWIEIFKAGRHISSNGITRHYPPEELDQVVQTYNPDHFKAPLIVSYPAHNTAGYSDGELHKSQLAFGFPSQLKRAGDRLLAGFEKISPQVKEWVNNGQILGFSSSFYLPEARTNPYKGKLALRHVAACGIDPPAVKGMGTPELAEPLSNFANYAEGEDEAVDFALEGVDEQTLADARLGVQVYQALKAVEGSITSFAAPLDGSMGRIAHALGEVYQRMRDRMIEDEGVEEANKTFPSYLLDDLKSISNQPSPMVPSWEDFLRLSERIDELTQQKSGQSFYTEGDTAMNAEFQEQFDELRDENERLRGQIQEIQGERERERVQSFVEGLVRDRKVLPNEVSREVGFILSLPNAETANYGEDGELTPRQAYMNKLTRAKELWSDRRLPISPADAPADYSDLPAYAEGYSPESIKLDRAIRAKCAALGKNPNDVVSYEEAWDLLVREGAASGSF